MSADSPRRSHPGPAPSPAGGGGSNRGTAGSERDGLDALLELVRDARGFDFTGYKRSSIERRVSKRMADLGVDGYEAYIDLLQVNGDEFVELFNTILIHVTGFFRDPATWEHLATDVLPRLLAGRLDAAPIRVWCAGCASGEEAYTVAMVMARVLGDEAFIERVKIYATDVDEAALDRARLGAYSPRAAEDIPREALERFFERTDQRYVFRKDLRRSVIFGRNDLVQDAPISRIDLLICRNTLMYFAAETQSRILRRFHFALDDDGILMLGRSEMLVTHGDLFAPLAAKQRVFRKVARPAGRVRGHASVDGGAGGARAAGGTLPEAVIDCAPGALVVLDAQGALALANLTARRTFGLGVADLGRPIQDLELSYRPVELRSQLELLASTGLPVTLTAVPWRTDEQERVFDVQLTALVSDGVVLGTSISYLDVTELHRLRADVATSNDRLEQAHEELQSTVEELETTNEELQSSNAELETTNEELQATNEELETMNEEVQSTVEELETLNEELQSSNAELETMNDELRRRTLELNHLNGFLETVLRTIGFAVAVIDRHQRVQIWNGEARDLWGLSAEEVSDEHFLGLEFGLPVERLKPQLRAALTGQTEREVVVLRAVTRRGEPIDCRVTVLRLAAGSDGLRGGAIVMMEPVPATA